MNVRVDEMNNVESGFTAPVKNFRTKFLDQRDNEITVRQLGDESNITRLDQRCTDTEHHVPHRATHQHGLGGLGDEQDEFLDMVGYDSLHDSYDARNPILEKSIIMGCKTVVILANRGEVGLLACWTSSSTESAILDVNGDT